MDVAAWLKSLGLERYAPAFRDNEIDWDALPKLSAEDLKDLGVVLGGHRRKLLDAIAALGTALPAATVTAPSRDARASADAERRQLTVMFCDLVGSTALSTRHDPEDLRELIGDYHRAVADTVGRLDGFVAKYMGDGVLIYFGYPQAHEDDAERAVRSGLAVIEAVGKLPGREDLSVRLGIATGLAVVGDLIGEGAAQERGVVGETPNLAARLQALAAPNALVIGEATRRQIGGLFDLEDLGAQQLAGFTDPQRAWRVLGESGEVSRFEALRSGETPLVGREEEVELLVRRWQQAKSGEGRVVLISGEPGIGKSRLTAALSEHIETEPHTRLRYFCSPHHQDSALYPFIAQLERAAGFARDDAAEARLGKLRALLAPDDDDFALLSELLSLPSSAAELNLSPQRKREKLFEALLNQLAALARQQSVLMVFEDAHWIDPTTHELLDLTVDRVRHLPVLLVITFRPEFQPPWGGRSQVASVALNRLGERDGEALVKKLAGNAALAADIVADIVERTDGVPLFVEELTKAVLESVEQGDRIAAVLATTSLAALSVPATLQASLMARLDRLGPTAKEIAQIGAVLGREFGYELIEPVAQRSAAELQAALDQLGEAGLLFCRGTPPHSSYLFKHALVQDAAYSTLLRGRRRELHARVADTLERARVIDRAAVRPEILAYHLAQTASTDRAVAYLREAAQVAAERWANAEAVQHLSRARELSSRLDDGPAKRKLELAILLELGPMLLRVEGFVSASVEEVYRLAQGLCAEGDDAEQRFAASWGLWLVAQHQSRLDHARQLAEELIGLGEASQDPGLLLQAHHSAWTTLFALGDDCTALRHAEEGINLYNIHEHRTHSSRYGGHDPGVCARMIGGLAAWSAGFPDRAGVLSAEAIGLGRTLGDPFSCAMALSFGSSVAMMRREPEIVEERCTALQRLLDEYQLGLGYFGSTAKILRGWAAGVTGRPDKGCELANEGLSETRRSGSARFSFQLGIMAEVLHLAGDFPAALEVIEEAIQVAEETGERRWLPRLLHDKAHSLMAATGGVSAAEDALKNSVLAARQQQARSAELRAATSLARLWRDQGKREEGRDLLSPVYGWFTEGFDTADLKEAKTLLDELA